ncbi:cell division protein FtsQ/DivIB [Acidithiobacillus sulfuriphilus]|uniref:Cell division protein FtsQ n=2 Tax=Acidithiobacillus sulfuriphilus TaxID=1867749 RepID=A0A3M8QQC7_9PROT|nr:cell division protein FtsQ/DivIB [Acidithiobacillus sulfuriphilus]RNF57871.1 FtsQ-type POTRA domain-containing protein [Acidithiobacillus sulfuriphilus]
MVSVMRDLRDHTHGGARRETASAATARPRPAPAATPRKPIPWRRYGVGLGVGLGLAGLTVAAWQGWVWLRNPQLMPIQSLVVQGQSPRIPAGVILTTVKPFAAKGFLWVNPDQVRHALAALPWVADAEVRRVWPDKLQVQIQQETPAARWLGGAGQMLDTQGQVFQVPATQVPAGLPNLEGPANSGMQLLQQLAIFNRILAPLGLQVADLQEDQRGAWRCILSNGVRLLLGRDDVLPALQRWVAIAPQIKEYLVPGATMDLRYTNGLAVAMPTAANTSSSQ